MAEYHAWAWQWRLLNETVNGADCKSDKEECAEFPKCIT